MDHWNCPVPSQVTWENNQSPLNEMHIHQQNHWNDILFYWYQSYHWYQWTISLTNRIRLCILDMCGYLREMSAYGNVKPRAKGRNIVGEELPSMLGSAASVCT